MTELVEFLREEYDDETVLEIGYGILQRASDLHYDPNPDNEEMAKRLKGVGKDIVSEVE